MKKRGLAGNNRISSGFDYYYKKYFLGTSDRIWGRDRNCSGRNLCVLGAYKGFSYSYNFISIISLFMFYFSIDYSINYRNKAIVTQYL
jgi:hypothetical protein